MADWKVSRQQIKLFLQKKGWRVYRVRWSDYQKMTLANRKEVINEIKQFCLSGPEAQ